MNVHAGVSTILSEDMLYELIEAAGLDDAATERLFARADRFERGLIWWMREVAADDRETRWQRGARRLFRKHFLGLPENENCFGPLTTSDRQALATHPFRLNQFKSSAKSHMLVALRGRSVQFMLEAYPDMFSQDFKTFTKRYPNVRSWMCEKQPPQWMLLPRKPEQTAGSIANRNPLFLEMSAYIEHVILCRSLNVDYSPKQPVSLVVFGGGESPTTHTFRFDKEKSLFTVESKQRETNPTDTTTQTNGGE